MAGPYTVSFTAGQMTATLMVSTVDDNTTELSEYFMVVITSADQPGVTGIGPPNMMLITTTSLAISVLMDSPSVTFVTILDNDPGNFVTMLL